MAKLPVTVRDSSKAFGDAPDETARMGQMAGILWMAAAAIAGIATFLPGAEHGPIGWVLVVCVVVFVYGLASATRLIHWDKASLKVHAITTLLTFPVIAVAVYLMGNAGSYVEPLLVVPLFYCAFFFPPHLAWRLSIVLIAVAGLPLLTDPDAIEQAFLPRYVALCVAFLTATWVIIGLRQRLVAAEKRQRQMANTDHLTGIGNRRTFDLRMRQELAARTDPERSRRESDQTPLTLLILDLDGFKNINDRLGHPVGDAVLCEVASTLAGQLRAEDTLARIGGDEFAVIAPGIGQERAGQIADSIRASLAADPDNDPPRPGASIGWAVFPDDGRDYESLQQTADARMLQEKRERRDLNPRPLA